MGPRTAIQASATVFLWLGAAMAAPPCHAGQCNASKDSSLMQKASMVGKKLSPVSVAVAPNKQGWAAVLDGMQQQLLQLRERSAGPVDDAQAALVRKIVDLIEQEMIPGLEYGHRRDVAALANKTSALNACYENIVEQNKTELRQADRKVADLLDQVDACQQELQIVDDHRVEICSRAAQVVSAPNCPQPSGITPADIQAVTDCYSAWLAQNATNHTNQCEKATVAWEYQKTACAEATNAYKNAVCDLRSLRTSMCQNYTQCYNINRAVYEELRERASAEAAGRQHEAKAIYRMRCMLDMLSEDAVDLAGTAGATKLQECSERSGDDEASKYRIQLGTINLTSECPLSGSNGHDSVECSGSVTLQTTTTTTVSTTTTKEATTTTVSTITTKETMTTTTTSTTTTKKNWAVVGQFVEFGLMDEPVKTSGAGTLVRRGSQGGCARFAAVSSFGVDSAVKGISFKCSGYGLIGFMPVAEGFETICTYEESWSDSPIYYGGLCHGEKFHVYDRGGWGWAAGQTVYTQDGMLFELVVSPSGSVEYKANGATFHTTRADLPRVPLFVAGYLGHPSQFTEVKWIGA